MDTPSGVFDNNVFVTAFIARSDDSASLQAVNAIRGRRIKLIYSDETLQELAFVLNLDQFRRVHRKSDREIQEFCDMICSVGLKHTPQRQIPVSLARDVTDAKFLDLALATDADFLVTNDRRHLLRLKRIGRTRIVTPHKFNLALEKLGGAT